MNKFMVIFIATVMSLPTLASDLEKEKRWEEQVVDALMDGDEMHLESDGTAFLAIEMPSESNNDIGVIVIHGMGVHPNWEQVVQPVRIGLAESGFYTVSIQMPVLANDAAVSDYDDLMPEAASRIDSAVQYLKQQGMNKVILIAHSLGTQMAAYYLSSTQDKGENVVVGFVGISMPATISDYLKTITLPALDLYGTDDEPEALKSVPQRKQASLHNENYAQLMIDGANHFFDDKETELLDEVKRFISGIN